MDDTLDQKASCNLRLLDLNTHDPVRLHKELLDMCVCIRAQGEKHLAVRGFIRLDALIRSHGELPPAWQAAVDAREAGRSGVMLEICDERTRQDAKWGGPEHDAQHSPLTWAALVTRHAMRAADGSGTLPTFRKQMVRAAALALAAIEACDRATKKAEEQNHG